MVNQETELKLAVTPRTLARLAVDPMLGAAGVGAQRMVALYFDTPRFALWRRRVSLRLRRERRRWVQTVKGGGAFEAGLHRRIEIEHPVRRPVPDIALLGDHELGKLIARVAGRAALAPAFRVEVERATHVVSPAAGVRIEVSIDRGQIHAGGARAAVSEIELELKQGPAWRLFELALAIAARYAVRLEHRSKAERGYELAGGARPAPARARLGIVQPEMSVNDAFKSVCWTCLNHLQANHRGVIGGEDPEYLHQARVALRRLRSGLDAFAQLIEEEALEPQVATVRELSRSLGPARDWDVLAVETLAPVMQQFPGHRGLAALERACARLRQEANAGAQRALASRRYTRLVLSLGGWLCREPWLEGAGRKAARRWQAPARDYAAEALNRYHRRVLKRGRGIGRVSLPQLHRLRIAAKKLRYAAGYFAPLFARRRAKPMMDALNDLQDVLGAINDCSAAPALIEAATRAARGPMREQARVIVSHWNAATLQERRRELKRTWKIFRRCDPFWT